ncbi:MAG TPA: hypothetical protein VLD62_12835 [Acidimicrobiia bacterium]|nr:hypothetical protein [Acidimicrobiia bacterium]
MTAPDEIRQLLREANPVATDALDDHDSARLFSAIVRRRDASPGSDTMLDTDRRQPETRIPRRRGLRPALVFSGAAVVALAILVPILMMGSGDEDVADGTTIPTTTTLAATTTTATPATTVPVTTVTPTTTAAAATTVPPPHPSPVTWERLPDQENLKWAYFGPTVEFDGRLVSVGQVPEEGYGPGDLEWTSDGAAWASDDGLTWTRIDTEGLDGFGSQEIEELIVTPDGLVATGYELTGWVQWNWAVWTSPDAETWTKAADLGQIDVDARLETDDGWLIVGTDRRSGAEVWTSPDLVTWTPVSDPDFASIAPDGNLTYIDGGARTPAGYLAVGHDQGGDFVNVVGGYSTCAAAWFSVDGLDWERIGTEVLCEAEEFLWNVMEIDGRWYVEGNTHALWLLEDPADPSTWVPFDETPEALAAMCPQYDGTTVWMGDLGIQAMVDLSSSAEWGFRQAGGYCATTDGGSTWAAYEADVLGGSTIAIAAGVVWNDRFIVLGQETVSVNSLPGQGAVWVGTPTG